MTDFITVEGDITAVDTATGFTTQGSITTPSRQVPAGVSKIKRIVASIVADLAAAGGAVFFLRLGGKGVRNGEQLILLGAAGGQAAQAGSDQAPQVGIPIELDDVDIDVSAGDTITVQAEMAGSDLGTARGPITLVFE